MHFSFWKSNVWLKAILQSDCDIKVFLEEWLTDYRAKLMRKCKLLLKVQYVCVFAFFAFTFKNLSCTDSAESVQSACNRFQQIFTQKILTKKNYLTIEICHSLK